MVPEQGCQFATLVQSADIHSITSVKCWEGIDLRWFNTLQVRVRVRGLGLGLGLGPQP